MGLAAGIVGLPNVGKSTIFNALTSGKAEAANYPFCTIDPNTGIVPVPDARQGRIIAVTPSKKIIPAFLELVDIAGLVKGASTGEGLGNQFLGHIMWFAVSIMPTWCMSMVRSIRLVTSKPSIPS